MALEGLGIPPEQERLAAGAMLIGSMWYYAATVLYPSLPLKQAGLYRPRHVGERPPRVVSEGLGIHYSRRYPFPVLLEDRPPGYALLMNSIKSPRSMKPMLSLFRLRSSRRPSRSCVRTSRRPRA